MPKATKGSQRKRCNDLKIFVREWAMHLPVHAVPLLEKNHLYVDGNHAWMPRGMVLMRYLPEHITAVVSKDLILRTRRFYETTEAERSFAPLGDRSKVFVPNGVPLTVMQVVDIVREGIVTATH